MLRHLLALVSVFGALVGGGWGILRLWDASRSTALLAGVLVEDIRSFLSDAADVIENPYVEQALGRTPIFVSRMELEHEIARRVLGGFWAFHLSGGFVRDLAGLPGVDSRLEEYYRGLSHWARSLRSPPPAPGDLLEAFASPGAPGRVAEAISSDPSLSHPAMARARLRELASADRLRLDAARAQAPALEMQWTEDRMVYCRSMLALRRMTEIQEAQKQGCLDAAAVRKKAACSRSALARFADEVTELVRVREINERKLKQKWSPRLYAKIACD